MIHPYIKCILQFFALPFSFCWNPTHVTTVKFLWPIYCRQPPINHNRCVTSFFMLSVLSYLLLSRILNNAVIAHVLHRDSVRFIFIFQVYVAHYVVHSKYSITFSWMKDSTYALVNSSKCISVRMAYGLSDTKPCSILFPIEALFPSVTMVKT